jgi:hypothetical protein
MPREYYFKLGEELFWSAIVAAVFALATILMGFHPEGIDDWRLWTIAAAGAVARPVGGALVGKLTGTLRG